MADEVKLGLSILPELETILGVSFSLCLAYLGLQRFRYRSKIRSYVLDAMGDLKSADEEIKAMDTYKSIARLGSIGENDRKLFHKSTKVGELHGFWSFIYTSLFECNQDRILAFLGALASAIVLIIAATHKIHKSENVPIFFQIEYATPWVVSIVIVQLVPILLVYSGRKMTAGAIKFADKKILEIKRIEERGAATAAAPELQTQDNSQPQPQINML